MYNRFLHESRCQTKPKRADEITKQLTAEFVSLNCHFSHHSSLPKYTSVAINFILNITEPEAVKNNKYPRF